MTRTNTSVFSSCREIAVLDADRNITLVQHAETRRIYVKKPLDARNADVYRYLRNHYIEGIPEVVEVVSTPAHKESGESSGSGEYELEEYVSGQLLSDVLDNGNLFPVEEAVNITGQLCTILQKLRSCRPPIVGCDLLPSNILFTSDGLVRIRDLRSSRQILLEIAGNKNADASCSGKIYGNSTDFPFNRKIDSSSTNISCTGKTDSAERPDSTVPDCQKDTLQEDIRSVGALFCRLITGNLPGDESSGSRLPGGKPGQVIHRCLNPVPSKRYPDLPSLLRDLDACRIHPTADHSITSGSDIHHSSENEPGLSSGSLSGHPYLLPGFRNGNPLHYLVAIFAYGLLVRLSLTFTLEKFPPGCQMWVERLVFFLCGAVILLFTGNWLDIWRHLRISRIRNPLLRLLVILIIDAVLFMLSILAIIFTGLALGVYHASWF